MGSAERNVLKMLLYLRCVGSPGLDVFTAENDLCDLPLLLLLLLLMQQFFFFFFFFQELLCLGLELCRHALSVFNLHVQYLHAQYMTQEEMSHPLHTQLTFNHQFSSGSNKNHIVK